MAQMGRYCRAYHVRDLRAFPGWSPDLGRLRAEARGPGEEAPPRAALDDEDVLYLHENLSVTDGIYLDENVVFAGGGPEWREFCAGPLAFAPPAPEPAA